MATTSNHVIDVNERTFKHDVIEQSYEVPVVVDFWAPWCGPCRMLGPILEQLAEDFDGQFVLAKLNTDENQSIAMRYGIQGIPAVKGFRDGKVVDEFVGAQPRPRVKQFIEGLIPTQEDEDLAEARRLESQGILDDAIAIYRRLLEANPDTWEIAIDLGRALIAHEEYDEARDVLERVPDAAPEGKHAQRLRLEIDFARAAASCESEDACRQRIDDDPSDLEARYGLASLLVKQQRYGDALEQFLQIIQRDPTYHDGAARKAMLNIFETLGDDHALTQQYRPKLAMFLYA